MSTVCQAEHILACQHCHQLGDAPGARFGLLGGLHHAGVEFVVVGGMAAVLQGAPIVTEDLDILHRLDAPEVDGVEEAPEATQGKQVALQPGASTAGQLPLTPPAKAPAVSNGAGVS